MEFPQAKCGRKDFEASLKRLRGKNADVSVEAVDIIVIPQFSNLKENLIWEMEFIFFNIVYRKLQKPFNKIQKGVFLNYSREDMFIQSL